MSRTSLFRSIDALVALSFFSSCHDSTADIAPELPMPDAPPSDSDPDGGSTPAAARPKAGVAIKFKPASAPDVSGYVHDTGELYGKRGNGRTYGWSVSHTQRGFYKEFFAGYGWAFPFWSRIDMLPGATIWEIAVPNGAYEVRVIAGGCNNGGLTQKVSIEGMLVLNATPQNDCGGYGQEIVDATALIKVRDGRLTVGNGSGARGNRLISVSFVRKAVT